MSKRIIKMLGLFLLFFAIGSVTWYLSNMEHSQIIRHKDSKILMRMNGNAISKDDVDFEYRYLQLNLQSSEQSKDSANSHTPIDNFELLRKKILDSLIERKILYMYIFQDQGYKNQLQAWLATCEAASSKKSQDDIIKTLILKKQDNQRLTSRLCQLVVIDQYLHEKIFARINVAEEEIEDYYTNHQDNFFQPDQVEIRQIVVSDERQAKEIQGLARQRNFAELAQRYSIASEAPKGGKLGPFPKGFMPDFFDIAFNMHEGEISPIIRSGFGFHIIMLERKLKQGNMGLAKAKDKIQKIIFKSKKEKAYQNFLDEALGAVKLEM